MNRKAIFQNSKFNAMKQTTVKQTGIYKSETFFCAKKNSWMQRLTRIRHTTAIDYIELDENKSKFYIKKGERVYADVVY